MVNTITARGWLEHRSRIQAFPSAIRPAWMIAGIWDSLRQNKPEEARARAGLSLAMLDQQGCDAGGWLIASELALETCSSLQQLHQPCSTRQLGDPTHQVDRQQILRPGGFKAEGPGGLSGQETSPGEEEGVQEKQKKISPGLLQRWKEIRRRGVEKGRREAMLGRRSLLQQVNEKTFCRAWSEELPSSRGSFRSKFCSSACTRSCRSHFADWEPLDGDH